MRKSFKIILWTILVCCGLYGTFFILTESYVPLELRLQVNEMIAKHDKRELGRLAANQKTKRFLVNLAPQAKCTSVADFQGGTSNTGYFPGRIGKSGIGITAQRRFGPFWRIERIQYFSEKEKKQ